MVPPKKEKPVRDRGKLLTILLVLGFISFAIVPFSGRINNLYGETSFFWIRWIVDIFLYIGIWQWRKMAVYGFFVFGFIYLGITAFQVYPHQPLRFVAAGVTGFILFNLLWYYAIKRKWQLFV